MSRLRHWCARCRWEGHEPFLFGSVQAATELEAERELAAAWKKVCPHPVTMLAVIPGLLALLDEP